MQTDEGHAFGQWLFAQEPRFLRGVVSLDGLPPMEMPEVAFAGRSNVGKSSLINALLNRHGVARVSNTPGRTKELNFFDLAGRLTLVDLPGYGFAETNRKLVDQWTKLIFQYLRGRANLKRVMLLIDSRHGFKDVDREAMKVLDEAAVSYRIVLTKADKPKARELAETLARTEAEAARHPAAFPQLSLTSSEKGTGLPDLRAVIAAEAKP
jgi:GTP-binding protein